MKVCMASCKSHRSRQCSLARICDSRISCGSSLMCFLDCIVSCSDLVLTSDNHNFKSKDVGKIQSRATDAACLTLDDSGASVEWSFAASHNGVVLMEGLLEAARQQVRAGTATALQRAAANWSEQREHSVKCFSRLRVDKDLYYTTLARWSRQTCVLKLVVVPSGCPMALPPAIAVLLKVGRGADNLQTAELLQVVEGIQELLGLCTPGGNARDCGAAAISSVSSHLKLHCSIAGAAPGRSGG